MALQIQFRGPNFISVCSDIPCMLDLPLQVLRTQTKAPEPDQIDQRVIAKRIRSDFEDLWEDAGMMDVILYLRGSRHLDILGKAWESVPQDM